MMDVVEDIDIVLDNDLYAINNYNLREYTVRQRIDHFNYWNAESFFKRFRLSKRTVQILFQDISQAIANPTERNADRDISPMNKLLLTLRFLATGSFYVTIGDFEGVHKSTAAAIIKKVLVAICDLRQEYIKFPENEEEIRKTKADFFNIARFPRVLGVVDGTHIKLQSPGGNRAEIFRCRKGYFSLNCQVICNARYYITDLVCRWPGSAHDAHIFKMSNIKLRFGNGMFNDGILIGDSGYPLKNYLMTPLDNLNNRAENLYNESLIRTRNIIERLFGIWKHRFPILMYGIRTKINIAQKIIVACAVIHNLACREKEEAFEVEVIEENKDAGDLDNHARDAEGEDVQNEILDYFWNLLGDDDV